MSLEEHKAEAQQRILHLLPDRSIGCKVVHISRPKYTNDAPAQLRAGRVLLIGDADHSNNSIDKEKEIQRSICFLMRDEDLANIWTHGAIAEVHGMTKWLQKATPEAKERDKAVFHLMADKSIHGALLSTCDTALAVDWMAEYKSKETLTARRAMRPSYSEA
ncbi:hypothetical protein BU17DRAFT_104276 [Hysterangium stoloniferum]|nr:hypothetical protein BU17DRAFT_104276 [Hysterangium stoloniferum]